MVSELAVTSLKPLGGMSPMSPLSICLFSLFCLSVGFRIPTASHSRGVDDINYYVVTNSSKFGCFWLLTTGNSEEEIYGPKSFFAMTLKIKYLGELKYFLGIEAARSKNGIFICQRKCTLDLLEQMGMVGAKLVETPIEQNHGLCLDSGKLLDDPSLYQRRLVDKLIYLTITRLDIGFVVNAVSQFMHAPRIKFLQAVY